MTEGPGFVLFLDDDNLIHPRMLDLLDDFETNHLPNGKLGLLSQHQVYKNGSRRISWGLPDHGVDTAMFCLHTDLLQYVRWVEDAGRPEINWILADRYFFWEVWRSAPDAIVPYDEEASFYNALVQETGPWMGYQG
jgi:hypothetical protein